MKKPGRKPRSQKTDDPDDALEYMILMGAAALATLLAHHAGNGEAPDDEKAPDGT